jgi:nitrile hydratase subunit beta
MGTPEAMHRFHVGDRVRVKGTNPAGNPRTPAYVRGKSGIVTALHGSIDNPLDHRSVYPPLCSVLFPVREVFGGASPDTLSVDLHEDWLAPAGTAVPSRDAC